MHNIHEDELMVFQVLKQRERESHLDLKSDFLLSVAHICGLRYRSEISLHSAEVSEKQILQKMSGSSSLLLFL